MLAIAEERQLSFFEDRLPHRPYCTEDLQYGVRIRPLKTALRLPYLQINPPHLRMWMLFDVDREGAALAWEDANLPAPAWAAVNRENGHAHLAYGLSAPVLVAENARRQPIRFLQGIEGAYREALQADRGYSGLITKNPKHPLWRVLYGPQKLWELGELAEYGNVEKYIPRHAKQPEEIGLGRNCITFEFLRQWAYRNIRSARKRGNFVMWQADCNNRGLIRNADFAYPLGGREVWHIAKSVAMWTWRRFDIEASDRRFHERQSFRGIAGNVAKWGDNDNKRASARLMAAAGHSSRQIAAHLFVNQSTVIRWLKGDASP
jgi:hypothetical protein